MSDRSICLKTRFLVCVAALFCHSMAIGEDAFFAIKPYILDVTQTGARVMFHSQAPCAANLKLRVDGIEKTFGSASTEIHHTIDVTGLKPGKNYPFQIYLDGKQATPPDHYQIRTAGRVGESFSFAVYGDPRPGENQTNRHHQKIVRQVAEREPAFSLVLGDMVDDGSQPRNWQAFFETEEDLLRKAAIYPVVGDNDIEGGKQPMELYFPGKTGYYHFVHNGVHFFGLSAWGTQNKQPTEEFGKESEQAKWFDKLMATEEVRKAPFRVVFLHDPVVIGRGHASEALRRTWHPLFKKHRVDLVFASWHLYERHLYDQVNYIITGGAGAELIWMRKNPRFPALVEEKRYHFCHVSVGHGSMTLEAITEDGTVLDSLRLADRSSYQTVAGGLAGAAKRSAKVLRFEGGADSRELECYLFSYNCSFCRRLIDRLLPRLAAEKGVTLKVHYFDLAKKGTYDLFLAAGADFGRQNSDVPAIFIGKTVLGGEKEITQKISEELEAFVSDPDGYIKASITPFAEQWDVKTIKEERFSALTLGIVLGAGLLDGLNPCAFTTLIFLISYLSLVGRTRRQILITGGMFAAAVFLTYMGIGIFFYAISTRLLGNSVMALALNSVILIGVLTLAVLSAVDFVRCLKGRQTEVVLQLPAFLKTSVRDRIRKFARNTAATSGASFVLGIIVTGMELTCTGQVYVPIVTMIADPRHRPAAAGYLFIYNVAFMVPLLVVFALAVFGMTSQALGEFYQRHMASVKFLTVLLFLAMAALTLYNMVG